MPRASDNAAGPYGNPVRVPPDAYALARLLVEAANSRGWRALGSDRSDRPTISAVVEVAIEQLARRAKVEGA